MGVAEGALGLLLHVPHGALHLLHRFPRAARLRVVVLGLTRFFSLLAEHLFDVLGGFMQACGVKVFDRLHDMLMPLGFAALLLFFAVVGTMFFSRFTGAAFELLCLLIFAGFAEFLDLAFHHLAFISTAGLVFAPAQLSFDTPSFFDKCLCFLGTARFLRGACLLFKFLEFSAYVLSVLGPDSCGQ